jgi:hypothetical protein
MENDRFMVNFDNNASKADDESKEKKVRLKK